MALEVDLGTFWKEALTTFTAAVLDDPATSFSRHAGTEPVLLLASALGRLVSHFHGRKKSRVLKKLSCPERRDAETSYRERVVNPSWIFF